jgi:chromosome segregation protein
LDSAEREASKARGSRDAIEAEIAAVNQRRSAIEERLAARDRERTEAWGRLTAIRAAHERLTVRAEALARRRAELAADLEARRAALGALADQVGPQTREPVDAMLEAIGESLGNATNALAGARAAGTDEEKAAEIASVRAASQRAATAADRAQELLAERRQGSLEAPVTAAKRTLAEVDALIAAVAAARDATGERAASLEARTVGEGGGDDVTTALRACSAEDGELQMRLRGIAEKVTESEVRAAQLRDRRQEADAELERLGLVLGRELKAAAAPIDDAEREEIERGLERLGRRREQLGPALLY